MDEIKEEIETTEKKEPENHWKNDYMAAASLILGILSLASFYPFPCGIAAIVSGVVYCTWQEEKLKKIAALGIVFGACGIILMVLKAALAVYGIILTLKIIAGAL